MAIGKKELTEKVAEGMGISKAAAAEAVNTVIGAIVDSVVAGEKVHLVGVDAFIKFVKHKPKIRKTRKNVQAGRRYRKRRYYRKSGALGPAERRV